MIKKIIYVSLVFFTACQSLDSPEKPNTLISEEKMVAILTDIAFVKAAKSSYKKVFDKEKINPETYILQKYNIDSLVFAENNKWYTNQIEKYEEIFTKVKSNLDISKKKYEQLRKEEDSIKKIQDSILKSKGIKKTKKLMDPKELFIENEHEGLTQDIIKSSTEKNIKVSPLSKKKKSQ